MHQSCKSGPFPNHESGTKLSFPCTFDRAKNLMMSAIGTFEFVFGFARTKSANTLDRTRPLIPRICLIRRCSMREGSVEYKTSSGKTAIRAVALHSGIPFACRAAAISVNLATVKKKSSYKIGREKPVDEIPGDRENSWGYWLAAKRRECSPTLAFPRAFGIVGGLSHTYRQDVFERRVCHVAGASASARPRFTRGSAGSPLYLRRHIRSYTSWRTDLMEYPLKQAHRRVSCSKRVGASSGIPSDNAAEEKVSRPIIEPPAFGLLGRHIGVRSPDA